MSLRVLLLATLLAAFGADAAAQEPDTAQAEVEEPTARPDTVATPQDTAAVVQDTAGTAQDTLPPPPPPYVPPRWSIGLTGGTLGFGTLQAQPVLGRLLGEDGMAVDSAVFSRSIEAEGGLHATASALWSLTPRWAVRLGGGVGRMTLRATYDDADSTFLDPARDLDGNEVDGTLLSVEGALRMRLPSSRRAQPYLELGGSALRWEADGDLAGVPLQEASTRWSALAALGAVIPLGSRLAATVQASTRVFRTPVAPAPEGMPGPADSAITLTFQAPAADPFADEAYTLTNVLRLEVGIAFRGGAATAEPADPAEPPASTSPTGR